MLTGLTQHRLVPVRSDPVEDHPGDPHRRVEGRESVQQGGDAVALAAGVDHQHHRRPQESGDLGRRASRYSGHLALDAAVEQAHDALDDSDVGTGAAMPVQRADQLLADEHWVEVAARPPGGQGVIARVDEIGTDLERRHRVAGLAQRTHQTRCHRGLPAARCRRGDHHRRSGHLSTASARKITTRCPSGLYGRHPSGA